MTVSIYKLEIEFFETTEIMKMVFTNEIEALVELKRIQKTFDFTIKNFKIIKTKV